MKGKMRSEQSKICPRAARISPNSTRRTLALSPHICLSAASTSEPKCAVRNELREDKLLSPQGLTSGLILSVLGLPRMPLEQPLDLRIHEGLGE